MASRKTASFRTAQLKAKARKSASTTMSASKSSSHPGSVLTADDLLGGGENALTRLDIPEITKGGKPGVVFIRALPAADVIAFAESIRDGANKTDGMMDMISKSVVNEDGSLIFTTPEQVKALSRMPIKVFNRIMEAVNESAGIGGESRTAVADALKGINSPNA